MLEGLLGLFRARGVAAIARDILDIVVVWYAVYRILLLLRGTRALQVGAGLGLLVLVYFAAQRAGFATAYALLDRFLASSLLVVVVIFQADIRRALMRVGTRPFLWRWRKDEEATAIEEVISAAVSLAQRRIGALIVFEREASLEDFVAHGTDLDAAVTRELLYTLFLPAYENPLHDGAVIIRSGRVAKAGTVLPLTANPTLDRTLGTRHRAGLGISEETDAVVVIVSEERGQISACFNGNIVRGLDAPSLRQMLFGLFYTKRKAAALMQQRREREAEESTTMSSPSLGPVLDTRSPRGKLDDTNRHSLPGSMPNRSERKSIAPRAREPREQREQREQREPREQHDQREQRDATESQGVGTTRQTTGVHATDVAAEERSQEVTLASTATDHEKARTS